MRQATQSTHEVFNQSPAFEDINLFTSDRALQDAVVREGGSAGLNVLADLGARTGSADMLEHGRLANAHKPELRLFDAKGHRLDKVDFHPSYHVLMSLSMEAGLHNGSWQGLSQNGRQWDVSPTPGANVVRSAGTFMTAQMEAGHGCPITMTNAAVATLLNAAPAIRDAWLPKILSRSYDPAFSPVTEKRSATIGMGMTEKQGGTDVRANTTIAEPAGADGAYIVTGHKWFMSAPMCDAFLILAQAPGGLSCFLLPRFLPDGNLNNIQIQRLKEKLGNRSNASSEVEFIGAHAWLVGEEGRGVREIIEMVTYTRLDCIVASSGIMRLSLANAVHHCSHRSVFGERLVRQPLMREVLADLTLDVEAATALSFRLARSFDLTDDPGEQAWRRLMTPVSKYWACKIGPALVYEAMECLGGNGYVEDGLVARAYREIPLNAIWEGSGNVMCLDVLRVLQREPDAALHVAEEIHRTAGGDKAVAASLARIRAMLARPDDLEANGRLLVERLALTAAAALLRAHAPVEIADAFIATRLEGGWRNTYGAVGAVSNSAAIVARAAPQTVAA